MNPDFLAALGVSIICCCGGGGVALSQPFTTHSGVGYGFPFRDGGSSLPFPRVPKLSLAGTQTCRSVGLSILGTVSHAVCTPHANSPLEPTSPLEMRQTRIHQVCFLSHPQNLLSRPTSLCKLRNLVR